MNLLNLLLACAVLTLGTTTALAQAGGKGVPTFQTRQTLRTVKEIEAVKKDDLLDFVCLECHSVSELKVRDAEDMYIYCKEGGEVTCPKCKKVYKTIFANPARKTPHRPTRKQVKYVNEDGKECAFIAVLRVETDQNLAGENEEDGAQE